MNAMSDKGPSGARRVGAHRHGFNSLFKKNGGKDNFSEVSVEQVHDNLATRDGRKMLWPKVRDFNWQAV